MRTDEYGNLADFPTTAEWNHFLDEVEVSIAELQTAVAHARIAEGRTEGFAHTIIAVKRLSFLNAIARLHDAQRELKLR